LLRIFGWLRPGARSRNITNTQEKDKQNETAKHIQLKNIKEKNIKDISREKEELYVGKFLKKGEIGVIWIAIFLLLVGWCLGGWLVPQPPSREGMRAMSLIPVNSIAVTPLYPGKHILLEGQAQSAVYGMVIEWSGEGSVTWQVNVSEADDFEVALCYASPSEGSRIEVVSGESNIADVVRRPNGSFYSWSLNYERIHLNGTLSLPAGVSNVTLRVTEYHHELRLRSLELIPMSAKDAIAAEREKARRMRASTDWFVDAGYGVMFHWTSRTQPRHGPQKPYADAVNDFDVNAFADMVEETGAGYVIFTVNHAEPHCPAPIESWERVHPGWTTQRDLIGDIADALNQRGIKLMLYFASHILGKLDTASEEEFFKIHFDILTEMGLRYGEKVAGYWFDGWHAVTEKYPYAPFERFFNACKAGNPDRIIALNYWIFPVTTEWQEYWAGELGSPQRPHTARYFEDGPAKGLQSHSLLMLDAPWVHDKPNTPMELPRFTDEELISYVKACIANQGVVTMNLGIYQDGTIGEATLEQMKALRKAIREP